MYGCAPAVVIMTSGHFKEELKGEEKENVFPLPFLLILSITSTHFCKATFPCSSEFIPAYLPIFPDLRSKPHDNVLGKSDVQMGLASLTTFSTFAQHSDGEN